jgi:hypothetical protein
MRFEGFDTIHCFLQRLDGFHVEHRIVDAFCNSAKVVAFFVAVGGFARPDQGRQVSTSWAIKTDLSVGLPFFEVVLSDLESLEIIPLGVRVDNVLLSV